MLRVRVKEIDKADDALVHRVKSHKGPLFLAAVSGLGFQHLCLTVAVVLRLLSHVLCLRDWKLNFSINGGASLLERFLRVLTTK